MAGGSAVQVFDGVAASWAGDAVVTVWNAPARLHRSRWLFDLVDERRARVPGSIGGLIVLLPTADPPDAPTRMENSVRLRRLRPSIRRVAAVALGDSFRVSIVRSVMRAMAVVSGISRTVSIETTLERGASALLSAATLETPSLDEIRQILVMQYEALGVAPDPWLDDLRPASFTRIAAHATRDSSRPSAPPARPNVGSSSVPPAASEPPADTGGDPRPIPLVGRAW